MPGRQHVYAVSDRLDPEIGQSGYLQGARHACIRTRIRNARCCGPEPSRPAPTRRIAIGGGRGGSPLAKRYNAARLRNASDIPSIGSDELAVVYERQRMSYPHIALHQLMLRISPWQHGTVRYRILA
jgi:hypothetical protein